MRKNKNKRKSLPLGLRFELLNKNPRCAICGRTAATGVLEIDHIDSDPSNNDLSNLQVLCADCNMGKYWSEQLKKEKYIK
jgi:5-methylcytosine-specific restriction endonuclease McrA